MKSLIKKCQNSFKTVSSKALAFSIKNILKLITLTCTVKIEGLNEYLIKAKNEPCIVMLWHNRLAIAPFLLSTYTPEIHYAALISASKDGHLLRTIVDSYPNGSTISVGHKERFHALKEFIRQVKNKESVPIITPDGPRGPCYELKPGIAIAAIETGAFIIPLDWQSSHYWQLSSWDKLRIPKPFSTITVQFLPALTFEPSESVEEVKNQLKDALVKN